MPWGSALIEKNQIFLVVSVFIFYLFPNFPRFWNNGSLHQAKPLARFGLISFRVKINFLSNYST